LHLLVFLFFVPKIDLSPPPSSPTIDVSLVPQPKAPEIAPEPVPIPSQPEVKPEPKIIAKKPSSKPSKPQPKDFSVPKVLTQDKNEQVLPTEPIKPQPQTPTNAPTDMASYIAQQRAKRDAAEQDAARQNSAAAAAEIGLTEEQKRDERIKNNLKFGDPNLFTILRMDNNSASFRIKDSDSGNAYFYEAEAKTTEDIRLAIIRQLIKIMRNNINENIKWRSRRLNRDLILSARPEDMAELEDFFMKELDPQFRAFQ
jgi:hypothetical protein